MKYSVLRMFDDSLGALELGQVDSSYKATYRI